MALFALRSAASLVVVASLVVTVWGAQPSETLLPISTKGFLSTNDVENVRATFRETQLGHLVNDPVMKPFIEDLKKQIGAKLEKAGKRMGLVWADMEGVSAGEVAIALVQPEVPGKEKLDAKGKAAAALKEKSSHATVLIVDITGHREKADALLAKVDANQKANKAVRSALKAGGVEMVVYTLPAAKAGVAAEKAYYFIKDEVLVATDDQQVATDIAGRFGANANDNLASHPAFKAVIKRNTDLAAGAKQQLRWFMEPFGYAEVTRAITGGRKKRGNDPLKILQEQGFTAIQGLGGYVFFNTGNEDVLHRTFVYAPAVTGKMDAERAKDKYKLAMRMLDFPNSAGPNDLDPQPWVLPDVASYLSFNCKLKDAFEMSKTLIDAFLDDGAFDDIWLNLENDVNGPKINIRKELVDLLGERVTVLTDVKTPIDLKSERLLALVEVKNPAIVIKALEKAFKGDPAAVKRTVKGHDIWELIQEEAIAEDTEFQIEGSGFVSKEEEAKKEEAEDEVAADPVLPNMALTVFEGHLVISTHVEYITEFIERQGTHTGLAAEPDFARLSAAQKRLGSGLDSFRFFTRTDEGYRATYELVKQNKLPQAETVLARVLNSLIEEKRDGEIRKSSIDGSKLPKYDDVSKYFGPGGFYVQSEKDGWLIVGCLLPK